MGCFIINVTSLRNDIESISRRYWDALALSLKTSIIDDVSIIQEFVSSSFQLIHTFSINQNIAETTSKYEYIIKNLPKVSMEFIYLLFYIYHLQILFSDALEIRNYKRKRLLFGWMV